jgi:hypothetical protein
MEKKPELVTVCPTCGERGMVLRCSDHGHCSRCRADYPTRGNYHLVETDEQGVERLVYDETQPGARKVDVA